MGKHDDHQTKTIGDTQVPKDIPIPPPPRDEGGKHRKDGEDEQDKGQDKK
jgi:hypothetical protein